MKTVRLCSEEHQRPEGSEPLELPEEGSNPLFQNNSRRLSEEHTSKSSWKKIASLPFPADRRLTATVNQQPILNGCCFTLRDEELLNTGKWSGPLGPAAAALSGRFIGAGTRICQRPSSEKRHAAASLWNDTQNTDFIDESASAPEYLCIYMQSEDVSVSPFQQKKFWPIARSSLLSRARKTG